MRRMCIALIVALAPFAFPLMERAACAAEGKRVALVVGNSAYQHLPQLASPANDARLMADALKPLGFDVSFVLDADQSRLERETAAFVAALNAPDTIGLFYYSGHALQIGGRNHLLPVSAAIGGGKKGKIDSLSLDKLLSALVQAPGATKIVVLEASRAHSIGSGFKLVSPGLGKVDPPKGTVIGYAAAPGKVTANDLADPSAYTRALATALGRAGLSIQQAFNEAEREVVAASNGKQTPWVRTALPGEVHIGIPAAVADPKAPETTVPVAAAPAVPSPLPTTIEIGTEANPTPQSSQGAKAGDGPAATAALGLPPVAPKSVAHCLKDERTVSLGKNVERIRQYMCRSAQEPSAPLVTVEFHRLSEMLTGALVGGSFQTWAQPIFGSPRIIENKVFEEAKLLFEKFGTTESIVSTVDFRVGGRAQSDVNVEELPPEQQHEESPEPQQLTYLGSPYSDIPGTDFPTPGIASKIMATTTSFPAEFKHYYRDVCDGVEQALRCTLLWRYMTSEDATRFPEQWRLANEQAGQPGPGADPPPEHSRYMQLIQYVTKTGWPEDFIVLSGPPAEVCGHFSYFQRPLIMDVVVITNASPRSLNITELLGAARENMGLRDREQSLQLAKAAPAPLPLKTAELKPGEKVLIPVGLTFAAPGFLKEEFGYRPLPVFDGPPKAHDLEAATKIYQSIQATPAGTVFDDELKKTRESFLPPSRPTAIDYVYGPELSLQGLGIDGERVMLEDTSANFLELTAQAEGGSCPYLYSWSPHHQTWLNHGKILHVADSKEKKATQAMQFARFVGRFRLAEEELEQSFIDGAVLEITLKNGRKLSLRPSIDTLSQVDGNDVRIYAGQTVEFEFKLPQTIAPSAVARSRLRVTGYYKRYDSFDYASR